mgnify:CR=1 FL=1
MNMSQMGLGLAMQAMGGGLNGAPELASFNVPMQPPMDPTIMELPQSSNVADDNSDRFSEVSSAVSGMSDLRQVRGQGRGGRRSKKAADTERSVDLDLS